MEDMRLAKLEQADRMLVEIHTAADAKKVIKLAEAARYYANEVGLGLSAQNHACEIKLRAMRRGAQILADMRANGELEGKGGDRKSKDKPGFLISTLSDIGIDAHDSTRWGLVAEVPEQVFDQFVAEVQEAEKELTTTAIMGIAKKTHRNKEKTVRYTVGIDVTVIEGDMLDVIPTLGKFDLVVADPPYNVSEWEWDKLGTRDDFLSVTNKWLRAVKDALNERYNLFWFCSPEFSADIEMEIRSLGLPIQSRIIWHRRNMAMGSKAKNKFVDSWEMIFHCGTRELNFPQEWSEAWFDVQVFAVPQTNFTDTKIHPTQKPLGLIERLVEFGSMPGDKILDPFAGSGTTGRASSGRSCVLIEKKHEYAEIIRSMF